MNIENKKHEDLIMEIDFLRKQNRELEISNKILNEEFTKFREKSEIIQKEIHHRVKNNFQIVMSLLNLQLAKVRDTEVQEMFRESENRIRAMALIHEKLYQSKDLQNILFNEYIGLIINDLMETFNLTNDSIKLVYDTEPVKLIMDQAIPCGLIINEILTNSMKYAFKKSSNSAEIRISLHEADEFVELSIKDNGEGIPDDVDIDNPETLGLQLITMLARNQLKGRLEIINENGTEFKIRFTQRYFVKDGFQDI